MRRLNQDFAQRGRFLTDQDLRALISELAPSFNIDAFFRDYVTGTRELDYDTYLGFAGLRLSQDGDAPGVLDGPVTGGPRSRTGNNTYTLEEIPNPSSEQRQLREGWLRTESE
jgi:predicted metalloprotease with PDZ domain